MIQSKWGNAIGQGAGIINFVMYSIRRYELILTTFILAALFGSGCTDDRENPVGGDLNQIADSGRIIQVSELLNSSFKKSKEYTTEGLPGADTVIYGFLKVDSDSFDYEVRFYKNHKESVELGAEFAEEGSGPYAVLKKRDALYKEGIRDRRVVIGGLEGAIEGGSTGPKYGGYLIYENLIMLCQGANVEQSMERCEFLTNMLNPNK